MNKSTIKLISWIIITAISLPFILNIIFGYIIPILPGIMYVGTNETWLLFIGGFLGASITLLGVHWQLEKTKEEQQKKLISNTSATYELLAIETVIIKEQVNSYIKRLERIIEVSHMAVDIGNLNTLLLELNNDLSTEKNIIFSFINESLPEEKISLMMFTNKLLISINILKKVNKLIKSLEVKKIDIENIIAFKKTYEGNLKKINESIVSLKSNQSKFEKLHI